MNIKLQLMWVACIISLPSMAQSSQELLETNPENFEITYNYLNLPCEIRDNAGNMISRYTYSADSIKRAVVDSNGDGKYYVGSFVYNLEDGEIASLESVASSGGRTYKTDSGYEVRYFITDHLGSVRAVVNADGEVVEQNDYMPYGTLHANAALQKTDNRYLYGGKELQTDFGINYYDSFARFQRNDGAFNSIDPLTEKFYSISPYAYCAGNPVNLVDPLGLFNLKTGEIEQGDNLASITQKINNAHSLNLTIHDIAKVNKISNPDVIYTGNYIILPGQDIELHFDLHSLYVYDKSYSTKLPYLEWPGTSGRDGYQDSKYQSYKNIGPIPEGLCDVNYHNNQHLEYSNLLDRIAGRIGRGKWKGGERSWGTHRTWIYPIGDTNTYGRSGFSIHGGNSLGSAGCIDLTTHNNSFHNWLENHKQVILKVKYD